MYQVIIVCGSDRLYYNNDSTELTYTDTYGESWAFQDADSFTNWWYMEGGPDLGEEVESFLLECYN